MSANTLQAVKLLVSEFSEGEWRELVEYRTRLALFDLTPTTLGVIVVHGRPHEFPKRHWKIINHLVENGEAGFSEIAEVLGEEFIEEESAKNLRNRINNRLRNAKSKNRISLSITDDESKFLLK